MSNDSIVFYPIRCKARFGEYRETIEPKRVFNEAARSAQTLLEIYEPFITEAHHILKMKIALLKTPSSMGNFVSNKVFP